jgi:hypothetical protein
MAASPAEENAGISILGQRKGFGRQRLSERLYEITKQILFELKNSKGHALSRTAV